MLDKALDRLEQGRIAAEKGDLEGALKHLTVSISLAPSAEAYVERIDVFLKLQDLEKANEDLDQLDGLEMSNDLLERVRLLEEKADAADSEETEQIDGEDAGSLVRTGVAIPLNCRNAAEVLELMPRAKVSSDGETLVRKSDNSVVWSCSLVEQDKDLVDIMANWPLTSKKDKHAIKKHGIAIYISGPNEGSSPEITQMNVAEQLLLTAKEIIESFSGIGVYVLSSGLVFSKEHLMACAKDLDAQAYIDTFVCFVGGDGHYYSCGMHALGYPDVQIAGEPENPLEFLREVALGIMVNELDGVEHEDIEFASNVWGRDVALFMADCVHFEEDHPYFNPYGMWSTEC